MKSTKMNPLMKKIWVDYSIVFGVSKTPTKCEGGISAGVEDYELKTV